MPTYHISLGKDHALDIEAADERELLPLANEAAYERGIPQSKGTLWEIVDMGAKMLIGPITLTPKRPPNS